MRLKRVGKILFCLAWICAVTARIQAAVDGFSEGENPYQAIWLRNAFDLKSASTTADLTPIVNLPPPNVQLTGITTIFGNKEALFMVQVPGKVPGKQESYFLAEGERKGRLEVLEINPKAETVRIKNDGVIATIALMTNRPAAAAASPVQTPIQGIPRGRGLLMHQLPDAAPTAAGGIPFSNGAAGQSQNGYSQPTYAGGFQAGYVPPTPGTSGSPNPGNSTTQNSPIPVSLNQTQPPVVSAETAAMLMAAQEAANEGRLSTQPVAAGVTDPVAVAAARAGAPPPPNFMPPPLPSSIRGAFGGN